MGLLVLVAIVVVAVFVLKGFDVVAGRGPKQISDGIERSRQMRAEVGVSLLCRAQLAKAKVCKHCGRDVEPAS